MVTDSVLSLFQSCPTGGLSKMVVVGRSAAAPVDWRTTSELVNYVRTAFAMSVTDLASALGVERPTIYSWLKDSATPSPAKARHLQSVVRLADLWGQVGAGGRKPEMAAEVAPGITLRDALTDDPFAWQAEIEHCLKMQAGQPERLAAMNRIKQATRDAGIPKRTAADFDLATGRPLSFES
ncbi:helix-turn-helix domain-containing protein [Microbacterium sp. P07]|uniref:helix-turn-helix domain-containing protein n=1 Tax=Microbacterium sp. P07 TaxID=3366952 RepID=UPI003746288A